MTRLCWVRHGETDWNVEHRLQGQEDIPLNACGSVQAEAVGQHLAKQPSWHHVVSSPLSRAWETAEIIARASGLEAPIPWAALRERDYGEASGLTPEERQQRFPDGEVPNIEPITAMRARVGQAMTELEQRYRGQRIIVVAHGGTINVVLSLISRGAIGTGKTVLTNASLSTTEYAEGVWRITSFNQPPNPLAEG